MKSKFETIEFNWLIVCSQTVSRRADKKHFNKQVVIKKDDLFDKTIPTWASDFKLLAKVTKL